MARGGTPNFHDRQFLNVVRDMECDSWRVEMLSHTATVLKADAKDREA
jgi:hypothetical protein